MRIVLDTNVLVSALITKGTPDRLCHAWDAGSLDLVTSGAQLAELEGVPEALLETIGAAALVVDDLPDVDLSPDPDDNVILANAIIGEADLLVTGDKSGLLELKSVRDVSIVTPREALERLRGGR